MLRFHMPGSLHTSSSHSGHREQTSRNSPIPMESSKLLKLLIHRELSETGKPPSARSRQAASLSSSVCLSGPHSPPGTCWAASSPWTMRGVRLPPTGESVCMAHRPKNLYILCTPRQFKLLLNYFNVSAEMKPKVLLIKACRFLCEEHS